MLEYRFRLQRIDYINGNRGEVYEDKKEKFNTQKELDEYKKDLEEKLGRKLYFTVLDRHSRDAIPA